MFWALTSIRNVWSHPCGKRGQMEIELLLFFPSPGTSELHGRGWQGSLSFQKSLCKPPVPAVSTTGGWSGVAGAHQCDRGDTLREAWEGILGWNRGVWDLWLHLGSWWDKEPLLNLAGGGLRR